jgi:hypothetical protein
MEGENVLSRFLLIVHVDQHLDVCLCGGIASTKLINF